ARWPPGPGPRGPAARARRGRRGSSRYRRGAAEGPASTSRPGRAAAAGALPRSAAGGPRLWGPTPPAAAHRPVWRLHDAWREVLVTSGTRRGVAIAGIIVGHRTGRVCQLPTLAAGAHRRRAMRSVRKLGLLLAPLLASVAAEAAPRVRPVQRPALEVRAQVRRVTEPHRFTEHVLRDLPTATRPPGAYAEVTRWVEAVTRPRRDGTPRLVVVTVPGGLGLAWARRW